MRIILKALFALIFMFGLGAAALIYTPFGNQALSSFLSVGNIPITDFKTFKLASSPNQYLICPENYCMASANKMPPKFPVKATELKARWSKLISKQPRISRIRPSIEGLQIDLVQRTKRIRYPDIITVRFIPIDDTSSTLAIYSRSIYGKSDFGENKARIDAWLAALSVPAP